MLGGEERNGRPAPSTNDFCSALASERLLHAEAYEEEGTSIPFLLLSAGFCVLFVRVAALWRARQRLAVGVGECGPRLLISASSLFLHECVLPGDEGDQDGSLYFLPSRCLPAFFFFFPPVFCF